VKIEGNETSDCNSSRQPEITIISAAQTVNVYLEIQDSEVFDHGKLGDIVPKREQKIAISRCDTGRRPMYLGDFRLFVVMAKPTFL